MSRRTTSTVAAVLVCVHTLLLAWGASIHAPVIDEAAYVVAGLSHWKLCRFELAAVSPPLVRLVAAAAILPLNPRTDWGAFNPTPAARAEHAVASDFIEANGTRTFFLFIVARWGCIVFSVLGAWVCFCWSRDLYGNPSALLAVTLWCSLPEVLAFGQIATPDIGAAATGGLAAWMYWRWLQTANWTRALLAGIALGLAQLAKTTWIALFPLWIAIWICYWWSSPKDVAFRRKTREVSQLFMIFAVAIYLLNSGYCFEGSGKPLRDYQFVSATLRGITSGPLTESGNRFAESWFAFLPLPFPESYILGLDAQRRDFELRVPCYLGGQWQLGGWWYFYFYALAIKVPLGAWLLFSLATFFGGRGLWRDNLVLWAPMITLLIIASSLTGINQLHYLSPILPFGIVWTSRILRDQPGPRPILMAAVASAIVWLVVSSISVFPHSLAYFNELAGGPTTGHRFLVGTHCDWGQDLLLLKQWIEKHPNARPMYVAYFGKVPPSLAAIDFPLPQSISPSVDHNQHRHEIQNLPPGWYAVSINILNGDNYPLNDTMRQRLPYCGYLKAFEPFDRAGYSINIYYIPD